MKSGIKWLVLFFVIFLSEISGLYAQELAGKWKAEILLPDNSTSIVVCTIHQEGTNYNGVLTISSPIALTVVLESIQFDGEKVIIKEGRGAILFEGKLLFDKIQGVLTWGEMQFPLLFYRLTPGVFPDDNFKKYYSQGYNLK